MASTTVQQQPEPVKKAPQGFQEYLKGVRHELRPPQTHWPSRPELIKMTQVVLLLIMVVAVYCGGIDFILAKLTEQLLKK